MVFPMGSVMNALAILVGGGIGLLLHGRLPEKMRLVVFQGLGLCVLVIGMQMAVQGKNGLLVVLSVLIGGILGELLRLEDRFAALADRLKNLVRSSNTRFVDGMVNASLIYCIGAMAILGAFDEGIRGDHSILFTKSLLDGFASIALASTYGSGVLFSALPVLLYQGVLTVFASSFQAYFSEYLIAQLTATGGTLILGIGINLLGLTAIRLSSLLPSLVVIVVLSLLVP
ncbi:MAG: DUF554 domain-containing protein [Deltaproteobacteria bacterium]|nr:DUF554 domain-containing protein [Deltaproteobacteria bacterium]